MHSLRRYDNKVSGILLDFSDTSDQIDLLGLEELGPVEEFPPEVNNREDADHSVREEECWNGPVAGKEDGVTTDESHGCGADASEVGDVWLEPAAVWQGLPGNALGRESFLEADEGESDDGEVDELGGGDLDLELVGCTGKKLGSEVRAHTKLTNQFSTTDAPLDTCRKLNRPMTSTMPTQ